MAPSITMAPSNGAGPTCCGISTTWCTLYPKDYARWPRWADGSPSGSMSEAKVFHPSSGHDDGAPLNWPWERQLLVIGQPFPALTRRRSRASCAGALSATSRNSSSSWPNRTCQSDNNPAERSRRHVVISRKVSGGTRSEQWYREQDGAGIPLRRLARPKSKSSRRLPSAARFPSTLNCYDHPADHRGLRCPGRHLHRGWEDGRKLSNRLELTVSGPGQ